jgi:hypothetical protein
MSEPCYPMLSIIKPYLWELNGLVLSPIVSFFGELPIWAKVCLASNRHSFEYHANTSPLMCGSKGRHLVISSSYHTYISFILSPLSYNIMYSFWLAISYNHPFFTVLMWSYHWQFMYPFVVMSLWEWTYNNPRHTSRYYCNYCFGEWNMCSKGGLPPFPSPHPMTNGYPYHKKQLPDFDGHCHCWIDSHKYGSTSIDDNNTCSDDGNSGEDMIIHRADTKQWLHSPHYWDIWVSLSPFRFIFDHLSTNHYHMSTIFFNPLNVCFSYW